MLNQEYPRPAPRISVGRLAAKRCFKGLYLVRQWARSRLMRLKFAMIWEFGGPVTFLGRIHARAVSGRVRIGSGCMLGPMVTIDCAANATLTIGQGSTVNQGSFIIALHSVEIGDHVSIGEYCSIRDNDHEWTDADRLIRAQGYIVAPVRIDDDVWIGRGAVIGKGVHVGRGAVIGASAVVVRDVAPYSVVAGVPAKLIKWRKINDGEEKQ